MRIIDVTSKVSVNMKILIMKIAEKWLHTIATPPHCNPHQMRFNIVYFSQIGIRFAPMISAPEEEAEAYKGGRYTFRCVFSAHPRPELLIVKSGPLGDQTLTEEYFRVLPVFDQEPYRWGNKTYSINSIK